MASDTVRWHLICFVRTPTFVTEHCDLLIKNCDLLTPDFEVSHHTSVTILEDKIQEIGNSQDIAERYTPTSTIDASGKICLPGLVDAHTHPCQQLLKGRTMDEYPMVWSRILVPFEGTLTPEDVLVSTQLCCLEMIKAGITAFADAGGTHTEQVVQATVESGLRAAITQSSIDMGASMPDSMKRPRHQIIDDTVALFKAFDGAGDDRIHIWFGIRQLMCCSSEYIRNAVAAAKQFHTGLHAHLAEHRDEVGFCLQNYRMRPAEFLASLEALGPNLFTAHNVLLAERELTLLAENKVNVVDCPRNNFTSHGIPKTPRLVQVGANLALGCDAAANCSLDLFEEMRVLRYGLLATWGVPVFDPQVMPAKDLLRMVTIGGATALLQDEAIGSLQAGKKADLVLLDIDQPHLSPTHNQLNTLISAASGRDITEVIVDGKILMRNREVVTLDEEKILCESRERIQKIAARAGL